MRELSLHILDIVTNSIEAAATRVIIVLRESVRENLLRIRIRDNGRGMSPDLIQRVSDPFVTTRTTRSIGMGLPLFRQAALRSDGDMRIESTLGKYTLIDAFFQLNNLNRAPLGDIADTLINLSISTPDVHFVYLHRTEHASFTFDSFWLFARMSEMDCGLYQLMDPARQHIKQGLTKIKSIA